MKRVPMNIDNMKGAKNALNEALQDAILMIHQKNVSEASVSMNVKIEVDSRGFFRMNYKTSVKVPMEIKNNGLAVDVSGIEWDEKERAFVMEIEGEQTKLEGG